MALAVLLSACLELPTATPPEENYGKVAVSLTDEEGRPFAGVTVELRNASRRIAIGRTGSDGAHRFDYVPPDRYVVRFSPPLGYLVAAEQPDSAVVVNRGAVTAVPLILTDRRGEVLVRVRDEEGQAIAGVELELRSAARRIGLARTGSDGTYLFNAVPPGGYLVNVSASSYKTAPGQPNPVVGIVVRHAERNTVPVALRRVDQAVP